MKVLLINTSEKTGGAAVACKRLMDALEKSGIDVKLLVRDKATDDNRVVSVNARLPNKIINKWRFIRERLEIYARNGLSKNNLFAVSTANTGIPIANHPEVLQADIIHLHWINQGFLSLSEINKLSKLGKPIIWTMHDMWPCTGICHYSGNCTNYRQECKNCFLLNHPGEHDLSSIYFKKKKSIWEKGGFNFVTCSDWLKQQTITSAIINPNRVNTIPNPLNIEHYRKKDKDAARQRFGLPLNKKLILYGAANVTDKRKGIDFYIEACKIIADNNPETLDKIELVFFGQIKENIDGLFPFKINQTGYINNDEEISDLYNAVDLFVSPSLEDNLPNTIMESMACGTPCVGFNIGGIPEMIDHCQNGYIAEYKSSHDLAKGIYGCLWNANYEAMSENAIKKVETHYSEDSVASKYIRIYREILIQN